MSRNALLLKLTQRYPGWVAVNVILGFSSALFNGVSTVLIVPVVLSILDQNIDLGTAPPFIKAILFPFDDIPKEYRLVVMTGAILLAIGLKNLTSYMSTLTSGALKRALVADLREQALKMLLEVDFDYFCKTRVGDILNRINTEVGRAAGSISAVIRMVNSAVTIAFFVVALVFMSWQLTAASTILLGMIQWLNQYYINRAKIFGRQLSELSKAYSIRLTESLSGIRLIKETVNEEREYNEIVRLIRQREKLDYQSQANSAAIGPIGEVSGIIALIVIVFLGRTFFSGQLREVAAGLLVYLMLLLRLIPFFSQLNGARSQFANFSASVDVVSDFLRRTNKSFMENGHIPYKSLQEGIHFDHISFAYPGSSEAVLTDVNLFLPKGKTLALVGASGAGKSTLADLLPRFYDPTAGHIRIDGIDLREFDLKTLRRSMGIVSQDAFLFNETIRNNIAYARNDATDDEILDAIKRANAYEFIVQLPQELDTVIGDRGVMLSGGQRQRLAIARALLKKADILILDEATSALDTVSERLVQAAIDEISRDCTTLVIAHRLSTIQDADQIAVLDRGKVVEVGTHDELLLKNGYYARLYNMQFSEEGQPTNNVSNNKSLSTLSHGIRNHLNSMLGALGLVVDDIVETPAEQQESVREAYDSAVVLLRMLESLEQEVALKEGVRR
ncbi:MAG: ATP-binding cassette domain-containing protein [Elainellaceae cyanobacterium]